MGEFSQVNFPQPRMGFKGNQERERDEPGRKKGPNLEVKVNVVVGGAVHDQEPEAIELDGGDLVIHEEISGNHGGGCSAGVKSKE